MTLPARTADTMQAQKALGVALFGPGGLARPTCPQPSEAEYLRRRIDTLREADALQAQLDALS
jgi:hypothetical protein